MNLSINASKTQTVSLISRLLPNTEKLRNRDALMHHPKLLLTVWFALVLLFLPQKRPYLLFSPSVPIHTRLRPRCTRAVSSVKGSRWRNPVNSRTFRSPDSCPLLDTCLRTPTLSPGNYCHGYQPNMTLNPNRNATIILNPNPNPYYPNRNPKQKLNRGRCPPRSKSKSKYLRKAYNKRTRANAPLRQCNQPL